jgi:hypothetical protein
MLKSGKKTALRGGTVIDGLGRGITPPVVFYCVLYLLCLFSACLKPRYMILFCIGGVIKPEEI